MNTPLRLATLALGILIATSPTAARAADVLDNVPHDALGFVVMKNLFATDTKVAELLKTLHADYPSPLVFLEAVTGIREGLDPQGDFMLAMLPSGDGPNAPPQYCVWLPVTDYSQMLTLLEATPGDPISAVRIADEDLLIARQGSWAVLMDPDQRVRMEQMLSAGQKPPATVAAWKSWINDNDAAVVLLRTGIQQVLAWSAQPPKSNEPAADEPADDLFGPAEAPAVDELFVAAPDGEPLQNPLYVPIRRAVHKWIIRSPKVKDLVAQADAIGCAARLDDDGNAFTSLRLKSSLAQPWIARTNAEASLPPALFEKGKFIVHGAGQLPPALMAVAASASVHKTLDDYQKSEPQHIKLDEKLAAQFHDAFVATASEITTWSMLDQSGDQKTGIFNRDFLVVRVPSAKSFVEHVHEVMDHWNNLHRETESDTSYVFDIKETKLGDRPATQFLLDVISSDNVPALPEVRQLMEKFFGPGGKMQVWVVPVDEHTVLLATATPEQMTAALQVLDRGQPIDWSKPELASANKLLTDATDWRIFFSPQGHYAWKRREAEAMLGGVPVIGAKPAKDFPESPPIAFSGKVQDNELRIDSAVPADTINSAGSYFTPSGN